jgi:hypothetical protein
MPTLVRGLRQFESIFLGWKLAPGKLVYTHLPKIQNSKTQDAIRFAISACLPNSQTNVS